MQMPVRIDLPPFTGHFTEKLSEPPSNEDVRTWLLKKGWGGRAPENLIYPPVEGSGKFLYIDDCRSA